MIGLILWRKPKEENAEEVYLNRSAGQKKNVPAVSQSRRNAAENRTQQRTSAVRLGMFRSLKIIPVRAGTAICGSELPESGDDASGTEPSVWAPPEQKNEVPYPAGLLQNRFILSHKMIFQGQFQEKADCMKERFTLLQIKKKYSFL